MKREEIEQLLAGYVNGELSPVQKQQLEELFKQQPELKQEAGEMLAVWQALDKADEQIQPRAEMDAQFYALLQREKADLKSGAKVVSINKNWLRAAAAVILCITAFGIGRFTAAPEPVFKYKTVYVKQPAVQQAPAISSTPAVIAVVTPVSRKAPKKKTGGEDNSVLAQQLRSVYTSERIAAVMKITGKTHLEDADLQRLELALQEDPNPNVRLTILDALRPLAAKQNVQAVLISSLSHQDDDVVKSSMVDLLIDNRSRLAIPQMIAMLSDKKTNAGMQNKIKAGIESFLN